MKKYTVMLIFLFALSFQLLAASLVVEKFSPKDVGRLPKGWKSKNHKMTEKAKKIYKVLVDGNNAYLYAHSKGDAVQIGKKVDIDIKQFPILTWRWKVDKLCEGADERYKKTGDSAAAIYVVFPTWKKWNPKAIKYVWSASSLPIGFKTKSPYASNTKIIILRNKNSPLHKWVQERVNVLEDYKYFFGKKIKHVKLIGIMTDSDNTHSEAIAAYDDIIFESR
ncbi:MAG: hypothetical protein DRG27_02440 [Deltaproteobacteria bacterium]|nr:MAG: hypothetical protein DRG27_02440 [Deltaproteobacteria bacterium]